MRGFRKGEGASYKAARVTVSYSGRIHGWRVVEVLPEGKGYSLACATPGCEAKAEKTVGQVAQLAKREMEGRGAGGCRACSRRARARVAS